ncbi:hypothetical protein Tco_0673431 [Tanacetum coccineum]
MLGRYDWSDQAEEGPNYALMAYSSSISDSDGNPQMDLQDQGVIDSGCSRHMTGNMSYLTDYEEIDRGYIHFGQFIDTAMKVVFVGICLNSKALGVSYSSNKDSEDNLHIRFSESSPMCSLYGFTGYRKQVLMQVKLKGDRTCQGYIDDGKKVDEDPRKDSECNDQGKEDNVNSTNNVNVANTNEVNVVGGKTSIKLLADPNMPDLEDYSIFDFTRDDEDDGVVADMNNLDTKTKEEPKKLIHALKDPSWIEAMQEELLHLSYKKSLDFCGFRKEKGFRALSGFVKNKRMIGNCDRNKQDWVAQGYTQEDRELTKMKSLPLLISWQCKKQTMVANSITEAEYVAASSCCGQSTVKAKTINGEVQLHALIDGKKIIITKSTVRRDLQLEDAEGVDCLPNSTIFEQLTLMGSKTTAWNEFSSTMASVIICLATN